MFLEIKIGYQSFEFQCLQLSGLSFTEEVKVMRRPELKIPTLAHISINMCDNQNLKKKASSAQDHATAIFIFIVKHKFLHNNSCKPVCKLLSVFKSAKYLKNLNNSGMKMIQVVEGGQAHHLAKFGANFVTMGRFVFTTN